MKPKVLSPLATWTPKMGVSTVFLPCSQSTFMSEHKHMKNIGELSEAIHVPKEAMKNKEVQHITI